jgi:hypothetical protein
MSYFMRTYECDTKCHAKNQIKVMHILCFIISIRFGFMNFYTEIYQGNDNVVKSRG